LDMFYNLSLEATELGSGVRKVRRSWQRILKTAREIFTVSQVCVSRNFACKIVRFRFLQYRYSLGNNALDKKVLQGRQVALLSQRPRDASYLSVVQQYKT